MGLRAMLVAAAVLLLIAGGVLANVGLSRQTSPEGTSQRYLDGLRLGDASSAWSAMEVTQPQQPVEAKLLDESSLKAALATTKPNYRSATVTKTTQDGASAATDIRVSRPEGELQTTLQLRRDDAQRRYGIYPTWRVMVSPAILRATLPEGASDLLVDGQAVHVSGAGEHKVAVLPVPHRVQIQGASLLEAQAVNADATYSAGSEVKVTLLPRLSNLGREKAKAAIKAQFQSCASSTLTAPTGCPQHSNTNARNGLHWQLIGDPTAGASVDFDQDQHLIGSGHFLMTLSYQPPSREGTTGHDVSGGAYQAHLQIKGSELQITSVDQAGSLPNLIRPSAASDDAAKALVKDALQKCASATIVNPTDCPQNTSRDSTNLKNIRWTLNGDPVSDATVSWDGEHQTFAVIGHYDMTLEYDELGTHMRTQSSTKLYQAKLIWDGNAYQLITIEGLLS
ncbi:hypothetical protein [Candidatus Dormiibacter inghamiae]